MLAKLPQCNAKLERQEDCSTHLQERLHFNNVAHAGNVQQAKEFPTTKRFGYWKLGASLQANM